MEDCAFLLSVYEYYFVYYLCYLKYNSSNLYFINAIEVYEYIKNKICNVKNKVDFFNNLQKFYTEILWNEGLYGHNMPIALYYTKFFNGYKNYTDNKGNNPYMNVINKMNKIKKPYDKDMKQYIKDKEQFKKQNKENFIVYDNSIIKNNKNEDVIMIKIRQMNTPTSKDIKELNDFLLKNKNLKELYIDIRGNKGGNSDCYNILYNLILNETLKFKYNNIKCYFKDTEFNKPFITQKLSCYKIYKSKKKNHKYTHYVIQHLKDIKYPNNKFIKYYNLKPVDYKGQIFIIIDHYNFSSAQMMLDISKGNKRFTILGNEKSSGSGIYGCASCKYADPTYFILPKTKILCQMDLFGYNHKKYLTEPDKPIPKWLK